MKCVLVLALLHFCVSVMSDTNLIKEIIDGLERLNFTYNGDVNIKVPARYSLKMPCNCSGVVIKELEELLSSKTVSNVSNRSKIQVLQKNLEKLLRHNDTIDPSRCLKSAHMSNQTFLVYRNFFTKLNRVFKC